MKKLAMTITLLAFLVIVSISQVQAAETYRVKSGDTLWKISQKVGVPIEIIIDQNDISNPQNIYVGQKLIIRISFSNEPTTQPENENRYIINYTVRSGDTLWKIAQRYNTTIEKIISSNNIQPPYNIYIGQTLRIPVSESNYNDDNSTSYRLGRNYFYYTVKPGDILWNIAQKYNTTVKRLVELNNIKSSYDLYAGRKLLVPLTTTPEKYDDRYWDWDWNYDRYDNDRYEYDDRYRKLEENRQSYVPYSFYEFKEGDKIGNIASQFGVRVSTLLRYNHISDIKEVKAGDILIIPLNESSKLSYLRRASSKLNNYYRVRGNETLAEIAEFFMVPEEGLRAINHMTKDEEVYTGQRLLMPVSPALFKKHQLYKVKAGGEYIYDIAFNKGVSIKSILKANYMRNLNAHFREGTIIVIPLDKDSQVTWIEYDENGNPKNSLFF